MEKHTMTLHNPSRRGLLGCLLGGFFGLFAAEKAADSAQASKPVPVPSPAVDSAGAVFVVGPTFSYSFPPKK